jgi:hypothetical protein
VAERVGVGQLDVRYTRIEVGENRARLSVDYGDVDLSSLAKPRQRPAESAVDDDLRHIPGIRVTRAAGRCRHVRRRASPGRPSMAV